MIAATLALSLLAAQPDSGPAYDGRARQLRVRVPRLDTTITVDGVLEEPVWARAARLIGFSQYQPVDSRPAEEPTEVLVWYSSSAIHFGIRAHELHGDVVRATHADRDNIGADDYAQILLDTYNDRRRAYLFGVNPFGVQQDGIRSDQFSGGAGGFFRGGGGFSSNFNVLEGNVDLNPDFVFESRGALVPGGYEVEIRIPFKSLRYGGGRNETWGINVLRRVQHSGYQDSWAPAVRASASFLNQSGWLDGLEDLRRGLVMDATPFLTTRLNGQAADAGYRYADNTEFGLNLHYGLTPNLSLDGTLNPDFSQVEADVGQVTLNERFSLFYPEKRPFFLDGLELFDTPNRLIYTRRIVDPYAGLKLAGKSGPMNLALLLAADDATESPTGHHPLFGVARLRRDLGRSSHVGVVATLREDGSDYNRVGGADVRIVHSRLYFVELQGVRSWTRDASGSRGGRLYQATWDRTGRSWGFNYGVTASSPDFEAAAGFVSRVGVVDAHAFNRLTGYGRRGARLETATAFLQLRRVWRWGDFGRRGALEGSEAINTTWTIRGGWSLGGNVQRQFYRFDPAFYAAYRVLLSPADTAPFAIPQPLENLFGVQGRVTTPTFRRFTASLTASYGAGAAFDEAARSRDTRLSASLDLRPTQTVRVSAQYTRLVIGRAVDGSRFSTGDIPRLKVEYQATRAIFIRLVAQYTSERRDALRDPTTGLPIVIGSSTAHARVTTDFRSDWLFSFRPSPGTLVYLGYGASCSDFEAGCALGGRSRRTSDGFFGKVSYLFRL